MFQPTWYGEATTSQVFIATLSEWIVDTIEGRENVESHWLNQFGPVFNSVWGWSKFIYFRMQPTLYLTLPIDLYEKGRFWRTQLHVWAGDPVLFDSSAILSTSMALPTSRWEVQLLRWACPFCSSVAFWCPLSGDPERIPVPTNSWFFWDWNMWKFEFWCDIDIDIAIYCWFYGSFGFIWFMTSEVGMLNDETTNQSLWFMFRHTWSLGRLFAEFPNISLPRDSGFLEWSLRLFRRFNLKLCLLS